MQPSKERFDFPAPAVAPQLASILRFGATAVSLVGRDQLDAVLRLQARIQRITVVSSIANHASWRRPREALVDGRFDEPGVMRRSACNPHGDRNTAAVRNCHDLGPFAAARWTNRTAPFLAPLQEASMKVSVRSNCPRASRSSAKTRKTLTRVPCRTHRWKTACCQAHAGSGGI